MDSFAYASFDELRSALSHNEITAFELVSFFHERLQTHNKKLNAAVELFPHDEVVDAQRSGPLSGIPGLVKDNICQVGRRLSCASHILSDFHAPYDATAVERLRSAGGAILGRANCDEFAMGSSGETSAHGRIGNPWDVRCVPGGSSGGSAAAVAAGLVPWALGSDTGGSVRQPAALCGIIGMKPTYGRVSRHGLVAYASSLDTIGVFTRRVRDNAEVLRSIAGPDAYDSTALQEPLHEDYTAHCTGELKPGLKIGVVEVDEKTEGMDSETKQRFDEAIERLERMGAHVDRITIPALKHGAAVYFMVSRAEAASNLARFDGVRYGARYEETQDLGEMYAMTRCEGFGHEVKRRILIGNYVLSSGQSRQFYKSAKRVQRMIREDFYSAFEKYDVLCAPTVSGPAFPFGTYADNALRMDLQDYYTASINLAGIPAISVPCGFVRGMPVGFQMIGPDLSEGLLYQTAYAYEQATRWYEYHPQ